MPQSPNRRHFLTTTAVASASLTLGKVAVPSPTALAAPATVAPKKKPASSLTTSPLFKISVAEYSLHRMIDNKELDPRDFGPFCKEKFGVDAVEYWMRRYADKVDDRAYMDEMHKKSTDAGVKGLLIMIDGKGNLGDPDEKKRRQAVENHFPWVETAQRMGCHSIRVNASSQGSREEQAMLAADGLRQLSEFGADHKINIIVENHGGLSSDGAWLADVMKRVDHPHCGTLPDFGNFKVGKNEDGTDKWYDRYQGVKELMPYAKAVSAKSHQFDATGHETKTDYFKMMKIVTEANYHGYVGIEWEGGKPNEIEGVLLTKRLLERVRAELSQA